MNSSKWQLENTPSGLQLRNLDRPEWNPLRIDFISGKNAYRRGHAGKRQLLAKAIGIKQAPYPTVIDATAGLGSDAFVLASLGCNVILIEQSEILFQLLQDAIDRAKAHSDTREIAARMTLLHGNAIDLIPTLPAADVIYIDPMFPEREKSALVKKPMQMLQALIGAQDNIDDLLKVATQHALRHVVLKRPAHFKDLPTPTVEFNGKTVCFYRYTP